VKGGPQCILCGFYGCVLRLGRLVLIGLREMVCFEMLGVVGLYFRVGLRGLYRAGLYRSRGFWCE
jgi:hypothetical protein